MKRILVTPRTRYWAVLSTMTALSLTLGPTSPLPAQQAERSADREQSNKADSHTGEFVSTGEGQLTMTIDGKNRHSHKITEQTKVTLNGKPAELTDLQQGDRIKVVMGEGNVAQAVVAVRGERQQRQAQQRQRQQPQDQPARAETEGEQERTVTLGVRLGESRTTGVAVEAVRPQSAAAQAGLRRGDYILSIDGTEISSPEQLDQALAGKQPGDQAELVIWRDQQKQRMTVSFAEQREARSRGRERPDQARTRGQERQRFDSPRDRQRDRGEARAQGRPGEAQQRAWLGVILQESEDQRVGIARIYPSGPAARAGLRRGDVIVSVDGQRVASTDEAAEIIANQQPYEPVDVVVLRGGSEQRLTITLADRSDFFASDGQYDQQSRTDFDGRQTFVIPEHAMMLEQHRHIAKQHQRLERLLLELQEQVQQLRQEVQQLKARPGRGTAAPNR